MTYILPSVLLAILLNLPKWFEFRLVFSHANTTDVTLNIVNITEVDYDVTDLRLDSDYIFYYTHLTR